MGPEDEGEAGEREAVGEDVLFVNKKNQKNFINALPLAYTSRREYANGKVILKFFCFFVFKQRRPIPNP